MFVHFVPNLTNAQKQSVISGASVDLLNGSYSNIPDYVKLQSRITSGYHWVYPCAVEAKMSVNDSIKPDPNVVAP